MRPKFCLAALSSAALALTLTASASAQTAELQQTNLGTFEPHVFTGHVLTPAPILGEEGPFTRILYAPSEADDPAFRAAISVAAGGATVDYFDAIVATPDVPLLLSYDAVFVWANFSFNNNVLFGDNLATYADMGGNVILGSFCTYTSGNYLSGAIMTPAYSPVWSPSGTNHFMMSPYVGDGVTCLYNGVLSLDVAYRDYLALQGAGVADGSYLDGEICHAYRPLPAPGAGSVVYSNGSGASVLGGIGDWDVVIANATLCLPGAPPAGSCTYRTGAFGTNPDGFKCVTLPVSGTFWQTSVDVTPLFGTVTVQTFMIAGLGGPTAKFPFMGFELLTLPPFIIDDGYGLHNFYIPLGLTGLAAWTQGMRIELDPFGNWTFVMLNAQDVIVG